MLFREGATLYVRLLRDGQIIRVSGSDVVALATEGVSVDEVVIPDDIHDFLLWQSWRTVTTATGAFFEKRFIKRD